MSPPPDTIVFFTELAPVITTAAIGIDVARVVAADIMH